MKQKNKIKYWLYSFLIFSVIVILPVTYSFAATTLNSNGDINSSNNADNALPGNNLSTSSSGSGSSTSSSSGSGSSTSSSSGSGSSGSGGGGFIDPSIPNGPAMKAINKMCSPANDGSDDTQLHIFVIGVTCFETITAGLAEGTMAKISGYLQGAVSAAMVFAIILFGAKTVTGLSAGEKLKSEFYITAIKIAVVGMLVINMGLIDMYYMTLDTLDGALAIVITPVEVQGCPLVDSTTMAVWNTMDCIFTKFTGWGQQNGYGGSWAGVPLLFGFTANLVSPETGGFFIGALVMNAILSLVFAFFNLAFVYILSIMGLILLFSIAPLIMPMILFAQTKQYFDSWIKVVISLVMQPIILFAFFSFFVGIFDSVVNDPEEGLVAIYKKVQPNYQTCGVSKLGNSTHMQECMKMFADNLKTMDKKLIYSLISAVVICYLMLSFVKFVTSMAHELAGNAQAPNLANNTPSFMRR